MSSYVEFVHWRRAVVESVIASLISAGWWSWAFLHPASTGSFLAVAAILFVPFLALRLIVGVGGALLDEERARNRRAGVESDGLGF